MLRKLNPLPLFRNRATRPRAIMWLGLGTMAFVLLWAGGIIGTSTEWFCTTPCHKVHDDNTLAYKASSHTNVSCIACHEPVGASPIVMTLMKVHVLPDLPATIFDYYTLPANDGSYVAMEMPMEQCTQCHILGKNRPINSNLGIIIDHEAHTERDITCTTCHNRVAHADDEVELVLPNGERHENWMRMDACFRCHGNGADAKAPATCSACHPTGFDLVPATHKAKGWADEYNAAGHAEAAIEESETVKRAIEDIEAREESESQGAPGEEEGEFSVGNSGPVNACYTCHERKFCDDCHGTEIPHPAKFVEDHSKPGYADPKKCAQCHARTAAEAEGLGACDACHHPSGDPNTPWFERHPEAVRTGGSEQCERCHDSRYCTICHVEGPESAEEFAREQQQ